MMQKTLSKKKAQKGTKTHSTTKPLLTNKKCMRLLMNITKDSVPKQTNINWNNLPFRITNLFLTNQGCRVCPADIKPTSMDLLGQCMARIAPKTMHIKIQ
jgi:hypothetical protein